MKLNLDAALKTILNDDFRGENPIPDPLRFSYIQTNNSENLKEIKNLIGDSYQARDLLTIDVPKSNFTIRPMGRPEFQDWIIYQAIIDYLISKIAKRLSDRTYSRLRFLKPKSKIEPWMKFDEQSRYFYENDYNFVVTTDISSYFENIDLDELRKKIINYIPTEGEAKDIIDFLFNSFLRAWSSGRVTNFGLPQGPTASSFLGDIYLDNVDEEMAEYRGYIRYMDDIRIFCKKEIEGKKALIKLVKALRKYKLNINAKKTRFLENKNIEKELFDKKKPQLDVIQSAFNSKNKSKIKIITPLLVNDIFLGGFSEENPFGQRHINFSLFRLSILKTSGVEFDENKVLEKILLYFVKKPHLSDNFCRFLALFPRNKDIENFLFKFLQSENNIYEWQEMHVLRTLIEMKSQWNSKQIKLIWNRLKDKNQHWVLRGLYCLIIGKYGNNHDRDSLIDMFDSTNGNELNRSLIIAVQQLGIASRNDFYEKVKEQIYPATFIKYIKSLRNPVYFRPPDRVTIERFEETDEKPY